MSETKVTKTELSPEEMNDLLEIPGAESIVTSDEKPSFFTQGTANLSFLTEKPKPKPEKKEEPKAETETKTEAETPAEKNTVDEIINEVEPTKDSEDASKGRPKVSKDAAVELTRKLIEKKMLVPFDDDKAIEDYTLSDFEELYDANIKDREERLRQDIPIQFFDSLPDELKYAAKYVADGGTDLKGLFRALSDVQQVRELSPEKTEDQETIIREYLSVTNFGESEDIESQITEWKDLGKLEEKADKFKPKLDRMKEEHVAQRLAMQEQATRQREEAAKKYTESVYEALKPSEINGMKIDKKTQNMLYSGLVQSGYQSMTGRQTNLLGHLLEKYQFVEPDYSLIAEVLWLLSDPNGYRSKVKEQSKNETTEKIVRQLKTEESKKISSSSSEPKEEQHQRKIPRNTNFFKR